ncbi:hypothetical protein [Arenimonas alkanexedens]
MTTNPKELEARALAMLAEEMNHPEDMVSQFDRTAEAIAAITRALQPRPEDVGAVDDVVLAAAKAIFLEDTGYTLLDDADPTHPSHYTTKYCRMALAALAAMPANQEVLAVAGEMDAAEAMPDRLTAWAARLRAEVKP